jgi:protein CpxP
MRIPKTSEVISISLGLVFALLISVGAAAQASPPPPSSSQPDAAPPAQSAPPPAQSQSSAPPSGNSSGANASAQSGSNSVDDELQLTPDQKQKIAAVVDDENKQISAVRDDNSMNLEQKQQKVLAIRQAGTPKIKAVLTPDQLQKLAAIQQRMRDQQGSQQAPAQNSAPPHQ